MKKIILSIISALLASLVITGCATIMYDKSIPLEESSTIRINYDHTVNKFDEKSVSWGSGTLNKQLVVIPAGLHNLTIHVTRSKDGYRYEGNVGITYDFLPSHTYFVYAYFYDNKTFARILDEEMLNRELVPDSTKPNTSPYEGKWVYKDDQIIFVGNEFIHLYKGKYFSRGFFIYSEKEVWTQTFAFYDSKKGIFIPGAGVDYVKYKYDGTTLMYGRIEKYRRME